MNEFSQAIKKVSSKKKKTDADYEQMSKLEFLGSLYLIDEKPIIPAEVILGALIGGAKATRRGKQAQGGIICDGVFSLNYKGPATAKELYETKSFIFKAPVKVGMARVIRTRPIFTEWSANVQISYDDSIFDLDEVKQIAQAAGNVGVGDWRPRYGQFDVQVD